MELVARFGRLGGEDGPWPVRLAAEEPDARLAERFAPPPAAREDPAGRLQREGRVAVRVVQLDLRPLTDPPGGSVLLRAVDSRELGLSWVSVIYRADGGGGER